MPPKSGDFIQNDPINKNFHFEEVEKDVFKNSTINVPGGRVTAFGGLLCCQSLAAADKTVSSELNCHSFQSNFILPVNLDTPVFYRVSRLFDGRSFATRYVECTQDDKIKFTALIAYQRLEVPAIEHQSEMPSVPGPTDSEEFDRAWACYEVGLSPTGRGLLTDEEMSDPNRLRIVLPYEYRCTDTQRYHSTNHGTDKHHFWARYKFHLEDTLRMHNLALLYISDNHNIMIAFNSHVRNGFIPSMNFSLTHSIYLYGRPFNANDWMLIELESTNAANGRGLTNGQMWNESGDLIASFTQEVVVRGNANKGAKL